MMGASALRGRSMPTTSSPAPAASQATIDVLTALLEARTGQQIAAYRSWRLDTALKPLLRERQLGGLDELVAQLLAGKDREIGEHIVDALLNQETSFYRDAQVFEHLVAAIADAETAGHRIRIWCAGDCGARARSGRFTQFEIQRGLPIRRMMRWFDGVGADWVAKPELVKLVTFRRVNLVSDAAPAGRFDLVLCRNVLLYLTAETKLRVFSTIARALRPGGLFVMGAGETVSGQTPLFEPSQRYRGFYETPSSSTGDPRLRAPES
jgi:chemotaxis protein methyltransferase CheR